MFEEDLEYYIDQFECRSGEDSHFDHNLRLRDGTSYYVPFYEANSVKQFIMLTVHDPLQDYDYVSGTIFYMGPEELFIYMRPHLRGMHIMSNFMRTGILKEVFPDVKSCTVTDDGDKDMLAARIGICKAAGLTYTIERKPFRDMNRWTCAEDSEEIRGILTNMASANNVPFDYSSYDAASDIPDDVCNMLRFMTYDEIFQTVFEDELPVTDRQYYEELCHECGSGRSDASVVADRAVCESNYRNPDKRPEFEQRATAILKTIHRAMKAVGEMEKAYEQARTDGYDFVRHLPEVVSPGGNDAFCRYDIIRRYLEKMKNDVRDIMEDYYAKRILDRANEHKSIRMARDLVDNAWKDD